MNGFDFQRPFIKAKAKDDSCEGEPDTEVENILVVNTPLSYDESVNYCRENNAVLATIKCMKDVGKLSELLQLNKCYRINPGGSFKQKLSKMYPASNQVSLLKTTTHIGFIFNNNISCTDKFYFICDKASAPAKPSTTTTSQSVLIPALIGSGVLVGFILLALLAYCVIKKRRNEEDNTKEPVVELSNPTYMEPHDAIVGNNIYYTIDEEITAYGFNLNHTTWKENRAFQQIETMNMEEGIHATVAENGVEMNQRNGDAVEPIYAEIDDNPNNKSSGGEFPESGTEMVEPIYVEVDMSKKKTPSSGVYDVINKKEDISIVGVYDVLNRR